MPDFIESLLHALPYVRAQADSLALHFDMGDMQSLMSIQRPNQLELSYTKTMMGFLLTNPNPTHVLMVGLGGGSMAKFCYHHLPETRITVVEINPHVVAMRRRFQIPDDDPRFAIVCADGADFVRDARQTFDVIVVDGFDIQGQAPQLTSRAFYADCCRALMPHGSMVVNLDGEHPAHAVFLRRIHEAFDGNSVEIGVEERNNRIVFASKGVAISSCEMSLSGALGHRDGQAQFELNTEFQRILQIWEGLDSHDPAGVPTARASLTAG